MRIFFSILLFLCFALRAFTSQIVDQISSQNTSKTDIITMTLQNDMKVFLKPYVNDDNIVSIQMTAIGGYTSFNPDKQPAARLCPDIAWESGFTIPLCNDIATHLYDYSIEFSYSVEPFYRYVLGSAPKEYTFQLLELLSCFLSSKKFTEKALEEIIASSKKTTTYENEEIFKKNYYELNGVLQAHKSPITLKDLKKITLVDAEASYTALFNNPNEFITVIVGDFDEEKIKEQLELTLAKLKKGPHLHIPRLDQNKTQQLQIIKQKNQIDARLGLSFPFLFPLTESNFHPLYLISQGIEYSLREKLMLHFDSHFGLDVSFEVPSYPYLANPWFYIEFHPPVKEWKKAQQTVLTHLQYLQKHGFTKKERKEALMSLKTSDEFWQNEDDYWLSLISDAALFGWNVQSFFKSRQSMDQLTLKKLNALLKQINLTDQTALISLPE